MTEVFFTVCSSEYIPNYRALRASIRQYCPTQQIIVGVFADEEEIQKLREEDGLSFQTVIDLNKMPGMKRKSFPDSYNIGTYLGAVRYKLLEYILEKNKDIEKVCMLGSDMLFYQPANMIFEQLPSSYNIAVTPHVLSPIPKDGKFPNMRMVQLTGHLNADFIIIRNNALSRSFIEWLSKELETHNLGEYRDGIFFDQTHLGFSYIFMPNKVYTITHPGINVAYYNLHERSIEDLDDNSNYLINGIHRLVCFHFSGFNGVGLSKYLQRKKQLTIPIVKLAMDYQEKLEFYGK